MAEYYCPNYSDCKLVNSNEIIAIANVKDDYISRYCLNDKENWSQCKRYIAKTSLNFCPDFVLPDTPLTPAEIIEKFDNELF